jgi:hypothetical protein
MNDKKRVLNFVVADDGDQLLYVPNQHPLSSLPHHTWAWLMTRFHQHCGSRAVQIVLRLPGARP